MRRFSAISAVVAGLLSASSAHALLVTIDDFNTPDMLVADQAGGGATTAPSPGLVPNGRTVSHELLSGINDLAGSGSKVTIGSTTFPIGQLEVANASGRNSEVKVSWTLAPGLVPTTAMAPAFVAFTVTQSDGNPTAMELFVNGTSEGMFSIPGNTVNDTKIFALSTLAQNTLAGGGQLMMVFDGTTGWDMTVDSVGIQVPEPTSVALVGLALVAAGVTSRRRKA